MFVEEVNTKFAGEVKINWRGGPEVMPPFKQAEGVRNKAMDMTCQPQLLSGSGADLRDNEPVLQKLCSDCGDPIIMSG